MVGFYQGFAYAVAPPEQILSSASVIAASANEMGARKLVEGFFETEWSFLGANACRGEILDPLPVADFFLTRNGKLEFNWDTLRAMNQAVPEKADEATTAVLMFPAMEHTEICRTITDKPDLGNADLKAANALQSAFLVFEVDAQFQQAIGRVIVVFARDFEEATGIVALNISMADKQVCIEPCCPLIDGKPPLGGS
jgi:hypothetical protein